MPELPEVETTLCGLIPHLKGNQIIDIRVRCRKLRWPIADDFETRLMNQRIQRLSRRGKYMLLYLEHDTLLIHLGMSGRLYLLTHHKPAGPHDHVDIFFADHKILRFTDPRRFGMMLLTADCPKQHPRLKDLGVEPLSADFTLDYLFAAVQGRRAAIKPLLMNSKIVVGVGNIYAAEALFLAGIHPVTPAKNLDKSQLNALVASIRHVLTMAIESGGTTLKDFVNSEGKPGYFSQKLNVYGRGGEACLQCGTILVSCILAQRSTVYCPNCQIDN